MLYHPLCNKTFDGASSAPTKLLTSSEALFRLFPKPRVAIDLYTLLDGTSAAPFVLTGDLQAGDFSPIFLRQRGRVNTHCRRTFVVYFTNGYNGAGRWFLVQSLPDVHAPSYSSFTNNIISCTGTAIEPE